MKGRVLIAGVGNIFLGDDGFGVEVAKRLAATDLPDWVQVADYGISGMHLAYDLADGYDTAILVDTAQRGGEPGTLTVIDASQEGAGAGRGRAPAGGGRRPGAGAERGGGESRARGRGKQSAGAGKAERGGGNSRERQAAGAGTLAESRLFDAHGMQPDVVLGVLDMLGAGSARVLVVGCEPATLDYGMELSEPVANAVDGAVQVVLDLVADAGVRAGRDGEGA